MFTSEIVPFQAKPINENSLERKSAMVAGESVSFDFEQISNGVLLSIYDGKGEVMERFSFQETGDGQQDVDAFVHMLDSVVDKYGPKTKDFFINVEAFPVGNKKAVPEPELPYVAVKEAVLSIVDSEETLTVDEGQMVTARRVDENTWFVKPMAGGEGHMILDDFFTRTFSLQAKKLKRKKSEKKDKKGKDKKKSKKKDKKK